MLQFPVRFAGWVMLLPLKLTASYLVKPAASQSRPAELPPHVSTRRPAPPRSRRRPVRQRPLAVPLVRGD